MDKLLYISEAVQCGRAKDIEGLIKDALDTGITAAQILNDGLLAGMGKLGVRFKNNEVYVPEVLIAARAMNKGIDFLKPYLIESGVEPVGRAVIATVKGDLHDIGKNLVKMMLIGAGFEVIDLGVDISEQVIVDAVRKYKPDILALSALLTTTMNQQGVVIEALKTAGLRNSVKVMVGGAPVTQSFCDEIGADGYTSDAASCAEVAKSFL